MTRMMVGLMGMRSDLSSSRTMPRIERITITTSNWFHLGTKVRGLNERFVLAGDSNVPITHVTPEAEGGDLHTGLQDENGREEVIEHLQSVRQYLETQQEQRVETRKWRAYSRKLCTIGIM